MKSPSPSLAFAGGLPYDEALSLPPTGALLVRFVTDPGRTLLVFAVVVGCGEGVVEDLVDRRTDRSGRGPTLAPVDAAVDACISAASATSADFRRSSAALAARVCCTEWLRYK